MKKFFQELFILISEQKKFYKTFNLYLLSTIFEIVFVYGFYDVLRSFKEHSFDLYLLIGICLAIKIYLAFKSNNSIYKFISSAQIKLGIDLSKNYMRMRCDNRGNVDTNQYMYLSTVGVNALTGEVIMPTINLMADLIIILLYFMLSFYIFGIYFLVGVLLCLIASYLYFIGFYRKIGQLGSIRAQSETIRLGQISESIQFADEIRVYCAEKKVIKDLENISRKSMFSWISIQDILIIPKIGIDAAIFFILILIFASNFTDSLPELFVLAAIGSRLAPIITRILHNVQILKQSSHNISAFAGIRTNNLESKQVSEEAEIKSVSFKNQISLINLVHKNLIKKLNLEIRRSEKICIAGESGSGKSTLLKILAGISRNINGEIVIDGITYEEMPKLNSIGYLPQQTYIKNGTICENIIWPDEQINDIVKFNLVCDIVQLNEKLNKDIFGEFIYDDGTNLSGGQRQRIGIARALYRANDILLLDESFSSLESNTEVEIINKIMYYFKDITLIHVSHRQENFSIYDKVFYV